MNALQLKNVRKNYKSFTLNDISLTLPSGCIMGLVGENGAGKSTLIKLILNNVKKPIPIGIFYFLISFFSIVVFLLSLLGAVHSYKNKDI